jgi:hypothetical protein
MKLFKGQEMPIIRIIEDENLVITLLSGRVSHHELLHSFDELSKISPNLSELYELVINTHDLQVETSTQMSQELTGKAAHVFNNFKRVAVSVVCPTDLAFGLARYFGLSLVNETIDVAVFRTEDAAKKWLDEMRSLHSSINSTYLT